MTYEIVFKPRAIWDLQSLPKATAQRILEKIEALGTDLAGDVRRFTNITPDYRLPVGDYRILFETEADKVIIDRVKHRSDAYKPSRNPTMISLHPEFLTKDGKKEFADLPYEEFVALQKVLADAADLIDLCEAKADETDAVTVPLDEVKNRLGLRTKRGRMNHGPCGS